MSTDHPNRIALNGPTMGTRWSAVFFAQATPGPALAAALQAAVNEVDAVMSTWKPDSDLMRLNSAPVGLWVEVPSQLCTIVALGLQIGVESGGAFDIGVGAVIEAWGFGASRMHPDGEEIAGLGAVTTQIDIDLENSRLRRVSDCRLDVSGIAKGFGVDRLADVLIAQGIDSFIVSIDGEMRACGAKPDGSGWVVGLERPDREARALARTIEMTDMALATSGDYRHWRTWGDTTVSHTIDPRKGAPLITTVCAVTVTAEHCAVADSWATALMVLGETDGPDMARKLGLDALFTFRRDGTLHEIGVGAFAPAPNIQQRGD